MDQKQRARLARRFRKVLKAFPRNVAGKTGLALRHRHAEIMDRLRNTDFRKISNTEMAALCRAVDAAFPAGDFGFSKEQNIAVNGMLDEIFDALKTF